MSKDSTQEWEATQEEKREISEEEKQAIYQEALEALRELDRAKNKARSLLIPIRENQIKLTIFIFVFFLGTIFGFGYGFWADKNQKTISFIVGGVSVSCLIFGWARFRGRDETISQLEQAIDSATKTSQNLKDELFGYSYDSYTR